MRTLRLAPFVAGAALLALAAFAQPPAEKADLMNFTKGQLPSDTGSDKQFYSIVDQPDLGKALKVDFPPGDSFGDRSAKVTDWKRYASVEFDAVNPGKENVKFGFNVAHRRSTNYQTRVEMPFTLKPGKNHVRLGIDEMANVNGSAPDLAHVTRWFIASQSDKPVAAYFGAITLEGGEADAAPAAPAGGPAPNTAYRVQGTIGDLKVDLLITPVPLKAPAAPPVKVGGDPARLERIRAAKMPTFDKPVLFNTPEADAILSALEVFPPDNPWNLVVSDWPLHPNSKNLIASIGVDKPMRYNGDMGFVLAPPGQKKVDVKLGGGADESDKGPYPVPDDMPIEGWPQAERDGKELSLDEIQRLKEDGDRHGIVVDPVNRMLYEFYQAHKTDEGWEASCEATFDLKSNRRRPDGWTSSDAAGLPIFPAVVRYDELKRGAIEHALRVSVVKTRRAYVYPATHYASPHTDENLPRMGERIRLRQDFDVSGFSPEVQTILKALKKYGMFVADNGIDWAVSVAPDPRIPVMNEELRKIKGSDFEVVTPPAGYKQPE